MYLFSIRTQDAPGVLNAVTSVFARRGYNIISLAVGTSETNGLSRITTVVPGTEASIEKLNTQLHKLVEVMDAQVGTERAFKVERPHSKPLLRLLRMMNAICRLTPPFATFEPSLP